MTVSTLSDSVKTEILSLNDSVVLVEKPLNLPLVPEFKLLLLLVIKTDFIRGPGPPPMSGPGPRPRFSHD